MKKKPRKIYRIIIPAIIAAIGAIFLLITFNARPRFNPPTAQTGISGEHQYVDTSLQKIFGKHTYQNTNELHQVSFRKDPTKPEAVRFINRHAQLSFFTHKNQSFGTATINEPIVKDNKITYPNIFPDTDLRYIVNPNQILEEFIIYSPTTALKMTELVQTLNRREIDSYLELEGSIKLYRKNQLVAIVPRPVMYELNNQEKRSYDLSYVVEEINNSTLAITKVIDQNGQDWLSDPERKYPVVIDLVIDNADTSTSWVSSDTNNTVVSQETSIKNEGTSSVKIATTGEENTTLDAMEYEPFSATGGTITYSGGYTIHTFTTNDTFVPNGTGEVEFLIVGGGGGGGETIGGGGGGGGVVKSLSKVTAQNYSVTIGTGGAGGSGSGYPAGIKGGDSSFNGIVAIGGGGGGGYDVSAVGTGGSAGGNGASGSDGGNYKPNQGNDGGAHLSGNWGGGGGGGGEAGSNAASSKAGDGGDGYLSSISGTPTYYGGGGGGGVRNTAGGTIGYGGLGGGGNGGITTAGADGTPNTGGGGGGGGFVSDLAGGSGGSGIVIIRYPTSSDTMTKNDAYKRAYTSNTATATGGTITDSNGFRIHTFTSNGTFTPNGAMNVEVLVVGGGGGGGETIGGGGGGGGVVYSASHAVTASGYTITVGAGGAGGNGAGYPAGIKGGDSSFDSITAIGGGAGAGYNLNAVGTGGSAGGDGAGGGTRASYTVGQGYDGGGASLSNWGGGAGGAGEAGTTAVSSKAGDGGDGLEFSISGEAKYYGGGGGGGVRNTAGGTIGYGGLGGGGNGGITTAGADGTPNTGGGGGGGGFVSDLAGGSGGSGIVIIRYPLESDTPIGGIITDDGDYRIHTFKETGVDRFVSPIDMNVEVLVVGGGGGGGETIGGGGGGGGVIYNSSYSVTAGSEYTISVGTGGSGGSGSGYPAGIKGKNSTFSDLVAIGGGAGAGYNLNAVGTGGSAGGNGAGGGTRASYTVGQGYDGGNSAGTDWGGGGGGGGEAGSNAASSKAGDGGDGYLSSISGTPTYYGGGGGGGVRNTAGGTIGYGGLGGGGNGGITTAGADGTPNTGGGGGGGGFVSDLAGGSGGSGIVIIRYLRPIQSYSESSIKTQGNYSLKVIAPINSLNKTLAQTLSSPIDLSNKTNVRFYLRSNRTGSNIKIGIHDAGGTTSEFTPAITNVDTYQEIDWDISEISNSDKDAIDQIIITIVNSDTKNTFYIDDLLGNLGSLNDTVTLTTSATDLFVSPSLTFWVRSDTTGNFARFQFGEDASNEQTYDITINSANTWEQKKWDISGIASEDRDAVTKFAFKFTTDTNDAIFYFDNIIINIAPNTPSLDSPLDAANNQSLNPLLKTTAIDTELDYLNYKIQLCTNVDMTANCQTFDQTSSQVGWSGQNTQTNTAYTSGAQATYTIQTGLSADTTYYWRSYAIDPGGNNNWSNTQSTPYSFTTSANSTMPTMLQTENLTNPSAIIDLTPEFSAIHSDPDGDSAIHYEIEVNTANDFSGTVMWDSGQSSMTSTANGARSPNISYAGTPLTFQGATYYWRIRFWDIFGLESEWSDIQNFSMNNIPHEPTLDSPVTSSSDMEFLPALKTTGNDADSDYLNYKIQLCTNVDMTANCQTFDQTSSQVGWSGQNTQTNTAYTSGAQATYTIQTGLLADTTYYWRSYAIDPGGSNTWSATQSTPYSFTTLATPVPASACYIQESINKDQLLFVWTDNAINEDFYEVQRSVDGGAWTALQTGLAPDTTSLLDTSITSGHTYQYRVAPYFVGPYYASWCLANTLNVGIGLFNLEGINASGLHFN